MIRIIDSALYVGSHSWGTIHAIERVTTVKYDLYSLPDVVTEESIIEKMDLAYNNSCPGDILLLPWVVSNSKIINEKIDSLLLKFTIVAAAGNHSKDIESFSPANHPGIITVGCLNKSGQVAALSNTSGDSARPLAWAPGTNFYVGDRPYSGTSISAAIYAGLLAESKKINIKLEDLLEDYKLRVKKELE